MGFNRTKKVISLTVIFCLLISEIVHADPAIAFNTGFHRESSEIPFRIEMPSALGRVEKNISPEIKNSKLPPVIHIQTIHANAETARQVQNIIDYLHQQYGVETVFAEGVPERRLNPDFLHFFGNRNQNEKILNLLVQQGELNGVDLALMRMPELRIHGVEDEDLYRKAFHLFRKLISRKEENHVLIEKQRLLLDKKASKIFDPGLRETLRKWMDLQENKKDLQPIFHFLDKEARVALQIDFSKTQTQFTWPQLTRFYVLQELERKQNPEAFESEMLHLREWLKKKQVESGSVPWLSNLSFGNSPLTRQEIEMFLQKTLPFGFQFREYPQIVYVMAARVLQNELDSKILFAEMQKVFDFLFEKQVRTAEEKELMGQYKRLCLLERLLKLELTAEDWAEIKTEDWVTGRGGEGELKTLHNALRFYRLMEQREKVFVSKIARLPARQASAEGAGLAMTSAPVVLVTGGFHAAGMSTLFESEGRGYTLITPKLNGEVENSSLYQQLMMRSAHLEKIDAALPAADVFRMSGDRNYVRAELKAFARTARDHSLPVPSESLWFQNRKSFLSPRQNYPRGELRNAESSGENSISGRPDSLRLQAGAIVILEDRDKKFQKTFEEKLLQDPVVNFEFSPGKFLSGIIKVDPTPRLVGFRDTRQISLFPRLRDYLLNPGLLLLWLKPLMRGMPLRGSFGRIIFSEVLVDGQRALFISEVQPSMGYHRLPHSLKEKYTFWRQALLDKIADTAYQAGYQTLYAESYRSIRQIYPEVTELDAEGLSPGSLIRNYKKPFHGWWKKITVQRPPSMEGKTRGATTFYVLHLPHNPQSKNRAEVRYGVIKRGFAGVSNDSAEINTDRSELRALVMETRDDLWQGFRYLFKANGGIDEVYFDEGNRSWTVPRSAKVNSAAFADWLTEELGSVFIEFPLSALIKGRRRRADQADIVELHLTSEARAELRKEVTPSGIPDLKIIRSHRREEVPEEEPAEVPEKPDPDAPEFDPPKTIPEPEKPEEEPRPDLPPAIPDEPVPSVPEEPEPSVPQTVPERPEEIPAGLIEADFRSEARVKDAVPEKGLLGQLFRALVITAALGLAFVPGHEVDHSKSVALMQLEKDAEIAHQVADAIHLAGIGEQGRLFNDLDQTKKSSIPILIQMLNPPKPPDKYHDNVSINWIEDKLVGVGPEATPLVIEEAERLWKVITPETKNRFETYLEILGRIGDVQAASFLAGFVTTPVASDQFVNAETKSELDVVAIRALGLSKSDDAVKALAGLIYHDALDGNYQASDELYEALKKIDTPYSLFYSYLYEYVLLSKADDLPGAAEFAREARSHPHPKIRERATTVLIELGDYRISERIYDFAFSHPVWSFLLSVFSGWVLFAMIRGLMIWTNEHIIFNFLVWARVLFGFNPDLSYKILLILQNRYPSRESYLLALMVQDWAIHPSHRAPEHYLTMIHVWEKQQMSGSPGQDHQTLTQALMRLPVINRAQDVKDVALRTLRGGPNKLAFKLLAEAGNEEDVAVLTKIMLNQKLSPEWIASLAELYNTLGGDDARFYSALLKGEPHQAASQPNAAEKAAQALAEGYPLTVETSRQTLLQLKLSAAEGEKLVLPDLDRLLSSSHPMASSMIPFLLQLGVQKKILVDFSVQKMEKLLPQLREIRIETVVLDTEQVWWGDHYVDWPVTEEVDATRESRLSAASQMSKSMEHLVELKPQPEDRLVSVLREVVKNHADQERAAAKAIETLVALHDVSSLGLFLEQARRKQGVLKDSALSALKSLSGQDERVSFFEAILRDDIRAALANPNALTYAMEAFRFYEGDRLISVIQLAASLSPVNADLLFPNLRLILKDPELSEPVRAAASAVLIRLKDPEIEDILIQVLRQSSQREIANVTVEALKEMNSPRARAYVALMEKDWTVLEGIPSVDQYIAEAFQIDVSNEELILSASEYMAQKNTDDDLFLLFQRLSKHVLRSEKIAVFFDKAFDLFLQQVKSNPERLMKFLKEHREVVEQLFFTHVVQHGYGQAMMTNPTDETLIDLVTLGAKVGAGTEEKRIAPPTHDAGELARWVMANKTKEAHNQLQISLGYDAGILPSQEERGKYIAFYLHWTTRSFKPFFPLISKPVRDPRAAFGLHIRGDVVDAVAPGQKNRKRLDYIFNLWDDMNETALTEHIRQIQYLNLGLLLSSAEDSFRRVFPNESPSWMTPRMRAIAEAHRQFERDMVGLLRDYDQYRDPELVTPLNRESDQGRVDAISKYSLEESLYPQHRWLVPLYNNDDMWEKLVPFLQSVEGMILHKGRVRGSDLTLGRYFLGEMRKVGNRSVERIQNILQTDSREFNVPGTILADPFIDSKRPEATKRYLNNIVAAIKKGEINPEHLTAPEVFEGALKYYGIESPFVPGSQKSDSTSEKSELRTDLDGQQPSLRPELDPFNPRSGDRFFYDGRNRLVRIEDREGNVWQEWAYDDEHKTGHAKLKNIKGGPDVAIDFEIGKPWALLASETGGSFKLNEIEVRTVGDELENAGFQIHYQVNPDGQPFYQFSFFYPLTRVRSLISKWEGKGISQTVINAVTTLAAHEKINLMNSGTPNLKLFQLWRRFFADQVRVNGATGWKSLPIALFREGLFGQGLAGYLNFRSEGSAISVPLSLQLVRSNWFDPWDAIYRIEDILDENVSEISIGDEVILKRESRAIALYRRTRRGGEAYLGTIELKSRTVSDDDEIHKIHVQGRPKPVSAVIKNGQVVLYQKNRILKPGKSRNLKVFILSLSALLVISRVVGILFAKVVFEFHHYNPFLFLFHMWGVSFLLMAGLAAGKSLIRLWRGEKPASLSLFSRDEVQKGYVPMETAWSKTLFWMSPFFTHLLLPAMFVLTMMSPLPASLVSAIYGLGPVTGVLFGGYLFYKTKGKKSEKPTPANLVGLSVSVLGLLVYLTDISLTGAMMSGMVYAFFNVGFMVSHGLVLKELFRYQERGNRHLSFLLTAIGYPFGLTMLGAFIFILLSAGNALGLPPALIDQAHEFWNMPLIQKLTVNAWIPAMSALNPTAWFVLIFLNRHIPVRKIYLIQAMVPFWTYLAALAIMGGSFSFLQMLATLIVGAGVITAVIDRNSPAQNGKSKSEPIPAFLNELNDSNFDADEVIARMMALHPKIRDAYESINTWNKDHSQPYLLKEHIESGLRLIFRHLRGKKLPAGTSQAEFIFLWLVHDLGKPRAMKAGMPEKQHEYTLQLIGEIFEPLSISGVLPFDLRKIKALIGHDPLGRYVRPTSAIELSDAVDEIRQMTSESGVEDMESFFHLLTFYWQIDIASYSKQGKWFFPTHFAFKIPFNLEFFPIRWDRQDQKLSLSDRFEQKYSELKTAVLKRPEMRRSDWKRIESEEGLQRKEDMILRLEKYFISAASLLVAFAAVLTFTHQANSKLFNLSIILALNLLLLVFGLGYFEKSLFRKIQSLQDAELQQRAERFDELQILFEQNWNELLRINAAPWPGDGVHVKLYEALTDFLNILVDVDDEAFDTENPIAPYLHDFWLWRKEFHETQAPVLAGFIQPLRGLMRHGVIAENDEINEARLDLWEEHLSEVGNYLKKLERRIAILNSGQKTKSELRDDTLQQEREAMQRDLAGHLWLAAGGEANLPPAHRDLIWSLAGSLIESSIFEGQAIDSDHVRRIAEAIWRAKSGPHHELQQSAEAQAHDWAAALEFLNQYRTSSGFIADPEEGIVINSLSPEINNPDYQQVIREMGIRYLYQNYNDHPSGGDWFRIVMSKDRSHMMIELVDGTNHGAEAMQASWFSNAVQKAEGSLQMTAFEMLAHASSDHERNRVVSTYLKTLERQILEMKEGFPDDDPAFAGRKFGNYTYSLVWVDLTTRRVSRWLAGHMSPFAEVPDEKENNPRGHWERVEVDKQGGMLPLGFGVIEPSEELVESGAYSWPEANRLILFTDGAWPSGSHLENDLQTTDLLGLETHALYDALVRKIEQGEHTGKDKDDVTFMLLDLKLAEQEYLRRKAELKTTPDRHAEMRQVPEFLQPFIEMIDSEGHLFMVPSVLSDALQYAHQGSSEISDSQTDLAETDAGRRRYARMYQYLDQTREADSSGIAEELFQAFFPRDDQAARQRQTQFQQFLKDAAGYVFLERETFFENPHEDLKQLMTAAWYQLYNQMTPYERDILFLAYASLKTQFPDIERKLAARVRRIAKGQINPLDHGNGWLPILFPYLETSDRGDYFTALIQSLDTIKSQLHTFGQMSESIRRRLPESVILQRISHLTEEPILFEMLTVLYRGQEGRKPLAQRANEIWTQLEKSFLEKYAGDLSALRLEASYRAAFEIAGNNMRAMTLVWQDEEAAARNELRIVPEYFETLAVDIPFLMPDSSAWLKAANTFSTPAITPFGLVGGIMTAGIGPQTPVYRTFLMRVLREHQDGGKSHVEIDRISSGLEDVAKDGVGIEIPQKQKAAGQPVLVHVMLKAFRESDREMLKVRLADLPQGSYVIAYDDRLNPSRVEIGSMLPAGVYYARRHYEQILSVDEVIENGHEAILETPELTGHETFLFASRHDLGGTESLAHFDFALELDTKDLVREPEVLRRKIIPALAGEALELVKLDREIRESVLAANLSSGLLSFYGGAYEMNLSLWTQLRAAESISAAA